MQYQIVLDYLVVFINHSNYSLHPGTIYAVDLTESRLVCVKEEYLPVQ